MNRDRLLDYPSSINIPNIISVTSIGKNSEVSYFADYGSTSVDLAAPGEDIISTKSLHDSVQNEAKYGFGDGTSFSTPIISGVAAILKSIYPRADYKELKSRLMLSVSPLHGDKEIVTNGFVNIKRSIAMQPQPMLVIEEWKFTNLDGKQSLPEAGENGYLNLKIRNLWTNATSIHIQPESQVISEIEPVILNSLKSGEVSNTILFNINIPKSLEKVELLLNIKIMVNDSYVFNRPILIPISYIKKGNVYQFNSQEGANFHDIVIDETMSNVKVYSNTPDEDLFDIYMTDNYYEFSFRDGDHSIWRSVNISSYEEINLNDIENGEYVLYLRNLTRSPIEYYL